jgi:hypothetical protein
MVANFIVRYLLCLVFLLPLTSPAIETPTMEKAAALDVVTTIIALSEGHRELNPLGLVGSTIVKIIVMPKINSIEDETKRKDAQNFASSIWTGAAVNNIAVILGMPPIISISVGIMTYLELRQ